MRPRTTAACSNIHKPWKLFGQQDSRNVPQYGGLKATPTPTLQRSKSPIQNTHQYHSAIVKVKPLAKTKSHMDRSPHKITILLLIEEFSFGFHGGQSPLCCACSSLACHISMLPSDTSSHCIVLSIRKRHQCSCSLCCMESAIRKCVMVCHVEVETNINACRG